MMTSQTSATNNVATILQTKRSIMERRQGRNKKNRLLRHYNISPVILLFCGFLLLTLVNSSRIMLRSPSASSPEFERNGMTISIGGSPYLNRGVMMNQGTTIDSKNQPTVQQRRDSSSHRQAYESSQYHQQPSSSGSATSLPHHYNSNHPYGADNSNDHNSRAAGTVPSSSSSPSPSSMSLLMDLPEISGVLKELEYNMERRQRRQDLERFDRNQHYETSTSSMSAAECGCHGY